MKTIISTSFGLLLLGNITLNASSFDAKLADKNWDGKKVPLNEVCSDYNMDESGHSPKLVLNNIPKDANEIVLSFSDETFKGMSKGGHGVVGYKIKTGTTNLTIPSFQGETYDLPENFVSIIEHRAKKYGKTPGAFLPPCSGGKGNTYSIKVEAVQTDNPTNLNPKVLATTKVEMGKY